MADPVTLTVLGGWAAAEGIKFLYGQAAELLKAWRERRSQAAADAEPPAEVPVPIVPTDVLDGAPAHDLADFTVVDREHQALIQLLGALSPYAQGQADIDLDDHELADQAGRLRALLETAYAQRFTFHGEQREPTGSRVTVTQALGTVDGTVTGVEADAGEGADVSVEQKADSVGEDGSVTGFKGRIGR
jgi:hypothetical protein